MAFHQALRKPEPIDDLVARYWCDGFVVVRGLFSKGEIAGIAAAADQVRDEGLAHGRPFRHGNLFYKVVEGVDGQPRVPMVQWPSYHQPVMNRVRTDARIAALLDMLIGGDLKQIINQVHWKPRGAKADFAWHQDSRSRRPVHAYRNLGDAYVQTGLAIDRHDARSGCMRFIPGSHALGDLKLDLGDTVLGRDMSDEALLAVGIDPAEAVDLVMEPGDVALWSPYLVHGSGANRSDHERRLYINGYVRAGDCDRGEWTFRGGRPVPLGPEQALVHYEALHERSGPHYL